MKNQDPADQAGDGTKSGKAKRRSGPVTKEGANPAKAAAKESAEPSAPGGAAATGRKKDPKRRGAPSGGGGGAVRLVFLGGLGEIGRNCACIEVDGRIIVLDCGIMFPDPDMPGVDLVLPDFTYLRENARPGRRGRPDPRARGPHRGLAYLLRDFPVPDLRFRAHPGPGPKPGRRGRHGRPGPFIPVRDGERRRIGPCRRGVHPGDPLGARTPSPPPSTPPKGSSCTPATSRSTSIRSTAGGPTWPAWAPWPGAGNPPAAGRLDQRRGAGLHPVGVDRGGDPAQGLPRPPGQAHHRGLLRQPHPPGPADRRRGHGRRPQGGDPGPVDAEERGPGPRTGPARHPRRRPSSTSRTSTTWSPAQVCVISTGSQGEPMSALSLMAAGENKWLQARRGRRGGHQRPSHPRQRDGRWAGSSTASTDAGPRSCTRASTTSTSADTPGRGSCRPCCVGDQAGVLHPRARRVPPHGPSRPPGVVHGHHRRPRAPLRGRRRRPP